MLRQRTNLYKSATQWKNLVIKSRWNRIQTGFDPVATNFRKLQASEKNFWKPKNIGQDILNQHAEMVAVSYLHSLHQRQQELLEDYQNKKAMCPSCQTAGSFRTSGNR